MRTAAKLKRIRITARSPGNVSGAASAKKCAHAEVPCFPRRRDALPSWQRLIEIASDGTASGDVADERRQLSNVFRRSRLTL